MRVSNILSERIKELRSSKELTMKRLGEAVGLSMQAINDIEKGRRTTTADKLIAIAEYFDVSVDYLLGTVDIPEQTSNTKSKLGERLTDHLKQKGISLSDASEHFGISKSYINRILTGDAVVPIEVLSAIADYLDVSTDYLLGRSDDV